MPSRLKHILLQTLGGQIMFLTGAMLLLYSAVAVIIWHWQDPKLLSIAAVLASLCYVSALLALLGEGYFSQRQQAALGMYWSMMVRTGVPLLAVMLMKVLGGPFVEAPAVCYLIAFYFGALIVQVVISYSAADELRPTAARTPTN
jgi:hypothetical protein